MSLRILFADDSVTAQNMGKKILTEAGYEVIAVSNGAAAVKKIAEQKPDIIILDVYMPGYSGLEVCEKVRSNIATIKTPVLLTVGKMEPYKPEDANRVRADGVIIKPFEASDLLAIIKKFEERIKSMPAPAVIAAAPARKPVDLYPEPETPEPTRGKVMQPMVEVPDHMASSSAFSDLLGGDSVHQFTAPAAAVPQADETAKLTAVPDNDVPLSWRQDAEPEPAVPAPPQDVVASQSEEAAVSLTPEDAAAAAVSEPEPLPEPAPPMESLSVTAGAMGAPPITSAPVSARPIQIPVYQDASLPSAEFMPTASAPIGDIDVPREPALQESAEEITRSTVADSREAGLVPTSLAVSDAASSIPPAHFAAPMHVAEMSVGSPADLPGVDVAGADVPMTAPIIESQAPEIAVEATHLDTNRSADAVLEPPAPLPTLTNDDFEARVAAAMAAYSHAQTASPTQVEGGMSKNGMGETPASVAAPPIVEEPTQPIQRAPLPSEPEGRSEAAQSEHVPEAASTSTNYIPAEVPYVPTPLSAAAGSLASATTEAVTASVEAELPAAASAVAEAAAASGADHHNIAQVVHRVMERMKGDLVDEIVRELKSRK